MSRWVASVLLAFSVASCASDPQPSQSADLRGTWKWDSKRSDPLRGRGGEPVPAAAVTLVIDQRGAALSIRRVVDSPFGGRVRQLQYSTDGRKSTNVSVRGTEVTSTSSWDQGRLITKTLEPMESPQGRVNAELTEVWTLSPDGRTLTVESNTTTPPFGDRKRTDVYLK